MPWKKCNRMHERLRFVARLLDGKKMAVVCREFAISRKTGYKIFNRYKEFGLPAAISTDNGIPFSSPHALFALSRLSVWWLRLGIAIERIMPGHPQQNGRHERLHLTLKTEATRPPGYNFLQQQALGGQYPGGGVYTVGA